MVENKPPEESVEPKERQASACANSYTPSVTTSVQPANDENTAPDIERFFCIYCGYDLTGHSGDERRCPECGNVTTIELLRAALLVQRRSIRLLEAATIPSLLFWAVAFTGAASIGTRSMWLYFLCAMSVSAWAWSLVLYLDRYGHHYDRRLFLLESHIVRLLLPLAALVLAGSTASLIVAPLKGQVATVMLIAGITLFIAWLGFRDLKRRLPAYRLPKPPGTRVQE